MFAGLPVTIHGAAGSHRGRIEVFDLFVEKRGNSTGNGEPRAAGVAASKSDKNPFRRSGVGGNRRQNIQKIKLTLTNQAVFGNIFILRIIFFLLGYGLCGKKDGFPRLKASPPFR